MALGELPKKHQQIAGIIERDIADGALAPGARLQPARKLAETFGVSLSVVTSACTLLENRGFLIRKPRSGVFVAPSVPAMNGMDNKVFLCMPSRGHFFHDLLMLLLERLNREGLVPLLIDSFQVFADQPQPSIMRQVREILASRPAAALIYGQKYWMNPLLSDFPGVKRIFLLEMDHVFGSGDNAALLDYDAAVYQLTAHLVQQGSRRVACLYGPVPRHDTLAEIRRMHHYALHFSGYERAMREAGLSGACRYIAAAHEDITPEWLDRLLSAPNAPDALVCQLDHTAYLVAQAARRLGVAVPRSLRLTGMFDTPWSRNPTVPLTTVRFDMEGLTEHLLAMLGDRSGDERILFCPQKIVVRRSTDEAAPTRDPASHPEPQLAYS